MYFDSHSLSKTGLGQRTRSGIFRARRILRTDKNALYSVQSTQIDNQIRSSRGGATIMGWLSLRSMDYAGTQTMLSTNLRYSCVLL